MDEQAKSVTKPRVLVMMATYNGESFVASQVESILAQQDVAVDLLICDDGSTDSTCSICADLADKHRNIIFIVNSKNKGIEKNFKDMLYAINPEDWDYFALSDQDDWWMPNKLSKGIERLRQQGDEAALYYSGVENVDADLGNPRQDLAMFAPVAQNLATLLTQNWACGCTMVFNRSMCVLLQKHRAYNTGRIHDVWIHLVALSCATTLPDMGNAYVQRRITGLNATGENEFDDSTAKRIADSLHTMFQKTDHYATRTARCLLACYADEMTPEAREVVEVFSRIDTSPAARLKVALDRRFCMPTIRETAILKMRILANRL